MLKALTKTRGLYERWRVGEDGSEFRTPEEQEWTATELKNSLRSIEWDVEDLEDTIQVENYIRILSNHYFFVISKIVEKNPTKFRIDGAELAIRKGFIESTKEEVRRMKERLTNQSRGNLERVANQVQG